MARDATYLLDILNAARKIRDYTKNVTQDDFVRDEMRSSAAIYPLIIVGEATKNLSEAFREAHPAIPWKRMAGMRDVLTHSYQNVDLSLVWEAAIQSIPDLITQIESLLPPD